MPLLDEQFLLAWARDPHAFGSNFYAFAGLVPGDQWGPLTPLSLQIAPTWHVHLLLAAAGAAALYMAMPKLTKSKPVSIVIPALSVLLLAFLEPLQWLGSRGLWLGFCLSAFAVFFFVRSRFTLRLALTNVTIAIVVYAIALAADLTMWLATPLFFLCEFFLYQRNRAAHRYDPTFSLLAPLVPVVLCGCALSAVGFRFSILDFSRVKLKNEYSSYATSLKRQYHNQIAIAGAPAQLAPSPLFVSNGSILYDGMNDVVAANRVTKGAPPDMVRPVIRPHVINPSARGVAAPSFGFPTLPEDGLYVIPYGTTQLEFDVKNTPGSLGVVFEFSLPGRDFDIPNGTRLSGETFKTVPIVMKDGNTVSVPIDNITEGGIYAVRAVAMDKGHDMIGHFSDTLYLLIQRPTQFGWSTQ
jgi:hypothetical protein